MGLALNVTNFFALHFEECCDQCDADVDCTGFNFDHENCQCYLQYGDLNKGNPNENVDGYVCRVEKEGN